MLTAMKYLTKETILKIREHEKHGFEFSPCLNDEYLSTLDPDAKLPVLIAMAHKQRWGAFMDVMRITFILPKDGKSGERATQATIDMPVAEYDALPEMD